MSIKTYLLIDYTLQAAERLGREPFTLGPLLEAELRRQIPEARVELGENPFPMGAPVREIALMIFAAGVTARLLASAVASVLDAYYNGKRALTQDKIHRPAINGTGEAIRDADGNVAYEVIMMQSGEGSQQERLFAGIDAGLVKLQIAAGDSGGRTTRP